MLDQLFKCTSIFFLLLVFVLSSSSIMVPETEFLKDAKVTPAKLEFVRDSVRFQIQGTVPIESVLSPKNPRLKLILRSSENSMEFGEIPLAKKVAEYVYDQSFIIAYEDWMEGAFLELQLTHGKRKLEQPNEVKILARGIITTPLLARVGRVNPDEPIPQVGLFIPTGAMDADLSRSIDLLFYFNPGSSKIIMSPRNQKMLDELRTFIAENPAVQSFKITGTQSPESLEGNNSKLGMDRASSVHQLLQNSSLILRDSVTEVSSRWNDWFDFRLLLRGYDKISTQTKDKYYGTLLDGSDYSSQLQAMKKIPGFSQVGKDLFPELRSAKIEVTSRPLPGLDQHQAAELKKALEQSSANSSLDMADWAIAGETSPRLDDKAAIYSRMTELFRSVIPYNNLAVVKMRQAQRTLDQTQKDELWKEANTLLYQASKIENNPYVLHNQGQILVLQGKIWEAYKKLSDASVLTTNKDFLKQNESLRGAIDIMRGDYKLATLRFDYSYSEPKDFFNKGLAYFLAGDFANASLSFEESVMAGRNYGYGFYGLALVAAESGQKEIALIQLEKAINASELIYQKALIDPIFDELRDSEEFFQLFRPSVTKEEN